MSTSPTQFLFSFPLDPDISSPATQPDGTTPGGAKWSSSSPSPTSFQATAAATLAGGIHDGPTKQRPRKNSTSKGPRGRYGCRTCRLRHLKCDETHPICANCTRAKRQCLWNHEIRMNHDVRSSSFRSFRTEEFASASEEYFSNRQRPATTTTTSRPTSRQQSRPPVRDRISWTFDLDRVRRDESGDYVANLPTRDELTPLGLLVNPLEASLFRFYTEYAGPWLDITSPSRHFGVTVPRLAVSNPVLLYACLSYSSKALFPKSSLSEQYSGACIKLLIPLLSNEVYVSSDETLLATLVILRHVEQYAEVPEDKGAHLTGAFGLIASRKVLPSHDSLPGAALWTYMRQDVRQALLNRASPKLTPSQGIQFDHLGVEGETVGESVWADRACHLAALACTCAWGTEEGEVDGDFVDAMLDRWRESLPREYLPYHISERSIQFIASWHVVGWQFYHLAKMLLKLYNSKRPRDMDILLFNARVESEILEDARTIFDITTSNSDIGCRFNVSAILGFAGSYFRDAEDQERLVTFLSDFSQETNWPTDTDRQRLRFHWQQQQQASRH